MASRKVLMAAALVLGLVQNAWAADPQIGPDPLLRDLPASGRAAQMENALLANLNSANTSGLSTSDASLLIMQQGNANYASITTDYRNASAVIVQIGTSNYASISQNVMAH